ncbi:MAG: hypothetical protein IKU71_04505, partial [Kiritimatiellae bacterium]|nr:hypothetical protein [Kiritimatiellia bacterium]
MSRLSRVALAFAMCCAGVVTRGDVMSVTVWRGESRSVFVSDEYPEIGGEAPGVTIRRGTLLPVRYNTSIKSLEYKFKADRAVYNSKAAGLHFATITAAPDAKAGEYDFG